MKYNTKKSPGYDAYQKMAETAIRKVKELKMWIAITYVEESVYYLPVKTPKFKSLISQR